MGLRGFLAELKRRGVYKTAGFYAAIAWLLLEVLSVVFQNFGAPAWVFKVITTVFLFGFPVACLMAWGFDITPEGVRLVGFKVEKATLTAENPPSVDALSVATAGAPVIAVLAFNNLSTDPGQEYFSDGIAEDIITDLSKLTELRVIARNSSFTYKGKPVDLKRVGRELGARYVLEGSVRRVGDRIRVTSQLSDAADGIQLWAERYDRDLTDIFMVQDELTLEIIRALRIQLSLKKQQQLTRRFDVSIEAHNLFLRGREQAYKTTAEDNSVARQLLAQAIELSPAFASAHAFVAFTHIDDYVMGWTEHPERTLEFGVAIARRAYEFEPDNPDVLVIMSAALQWSRRLDDSLEFAQRCLQVAPNYAMGWLQLANLLHYLDDDEESLRSLDRYFELDPLYPDVALYFRAEAESALGRYQDAVDTLRQRLVRNPRSQTSYALLASCYGHLDRKEEASAAWSEVLKIEPGFSSERRHRILPYKNPETFEQRIEGLRKAGLQV
jgi:TolB-like protein